MSHVTEIAVALRLPVSLVCPRPKKLKGNEVFHRRRMLPMEEQELIVIIN
jgi:hypothetical protein